MQPFNKRLFSAYKTFKRLFSLIKEETGIYLSTPTSFHGKDNARPEWHRFQRSPSLDARTDGATEDFIYKQKYMKSY